MAARFEGETKKRETRLCQLDLFGMVGFIHVVSEGFEACRHQEVEYPGDECAISAYRSR